MTEEISLETRREMLWQLAKARRDEFIDAGVNLPGLGKIQTDEVSRLNIVGAAAGAVIATVTAQPFPSIAWTLADNSVVNLNAAQIMGAGVRVISYIAACHANAQALRTAIEAAQTSEALAAINTEAGWPE